MTEINTFQKLLDAGYNLANNKIDIKPSTLLRGLRLTLTNHEIKDVVKVIRFLETKGFYQKNMLEKLVVKKEYFLIFLDC